jgi:MFS family permease
LRPRTDLLVEVDAGDGVYVQHEGPFERYQRQVEIEPAGDGFRLTQTVEFRLALPYFRFLFTGPVRSALKREGRERAPWWAPPEHLDAGASNALGTLAILAVAFGYLNTLFTQTIPFAGEEFGAGNSAQGVAGSVVRVGGLIALVIVATADRRGRRSVILASAGAGCILAATGALAPSLPWLTGSQLLARAFASALLLLVSIVAAEEMPAGSRAYAISLLAMAGGLGAGVCVLALNLADLGPKGWRLLYLLPLLVLPAVASTRHHLRESRRFLAPHRKVPIAGHGGRLVLLGVSAVLLNVYIAPYSQFSNRFLRTDLGFSGGRIGLFSIVVGTPAAIGIVAGGRIADVKGRRIVAAVALVGGTACTLAFFFSGGWPLWVWATVGAVVSAASIPALGVYGPELFPTGLRGKANGVVGLTGLVGSAIGLTGAGLMSDHFGSIGPAMAVLSAGPLLLAILVMAAYPETARRPLEDLNPEDRSPEDRSPGTPAGPAPSP